MEHYVRDPDGEHDRLVHDYEYADAKAARRAAATFERVASKAAPRARELKAVKELARALAAVEPRDARLSHELVGECVLRVTLVLRLDMDEAAEAARTDEHREYHKEPLPSERINEAVHAAALALGGLDEEQVAVQDEAARRAKDREAAAALPVTNEELLANLEAVEERLLRFEKVFLATLRTSVRAGAVLDGQRLEATKILERVRG